MFGRLSEFAVEICIVIEGVLCVVRCMSYGARACTPPPAFPFWGLAKGGPPSRLAELARAGGCLSKGYPVRGGNKPSGYTGRSPGAGTFISILSAHSM